MNFDFNETQTMFRDMTRDFANQEIRPIARQMDEEGTIPDDLIRKMADNGFFGLTFPEQYGGLGADATTYALVVEELSKVSAGVSVMLTVHNSVGSYPVAMYGSEETKAKYLPRMAAGEIAAFCITEPGAGSDAASLTSTARKKGEGYVLNGSKVFVTNGTRAQFYVVMARTPLTTGHQDIHSFIVERGSPGLTVAKKEDKMGLRASDTVAVDLESVRVPADHLLGQEGDGFKIAMSALDGGRIGIAFQALGIGQACLEEAIKYAQVREQFGKPIAQQPVIGHMIADMGAELEAARLLGFKAAWLKDNGRPCTKEAAMAKVMATEAAWRAADKALQIHGGYGYCKEYDVERYYRDVRVTRIYEGTSEIQRLVIARELLKELS
ncbi:acyl-CoA dehydrogenase [bacterium DOLJORAL78_65_58]|nr:MAG: acyl-CoA dehydrogenase [bacterium DOLZORAL124_64_63]PIE76634.1 MAG: acyl-CoA dehydrogenase [bacterium DOLJORAL78_65_58]